MDSVAPSSHDPAVPKRVLIVDVDESFLGTMATWLTDAGHHVVPFKDFTAAKSYLATAGADVLITDVRLGSFNGLQLVIIGQLDHPGMRSFVVTKIDDPVIRRDSTNAGAKFMLKPITQLQLLHQLH